MECFKVRSARAEWNRFSSGKKSAFPSRRSQKAYFSSYTFAHSTWIEIYIYCYHWYNELKKNCKPKLIVESGFSVVQQNSGCNTTNKSNAMQKDKFLHYWLRNCSYHKFCISIEDLLVASQYWRMISTRDDNMCTFVRIHCWRWFWLACTMLSHTIRCMPYEHEVNQYDHYHDAI